MSLESSREPLSQAGREGSHTLLCRTRHLKCGEERPACIRCVSAGFECEGYRPGKRPRARALLPSSRALSTLVRIPQVSMFEDESESRYFGFFLTQPAICLSGYFDRDCKNAWTLADRLVVQTSYQERFVRHAIVAIAALHKTMETSSLSSAMGIDTGFECMEEKQHRSFALLQYAKALTLSMLFSKSKLSYLAAVYVSTP